MGRFAGRQIDGKDNNASITSHTGGLSPATESRLRWIQTVDQDSNKQGKCLSFIKWMEWREFRCD